VKKNENVFDDFRQSHIKRKFSFSITNNKLKLNNYKIIHMFVTKRNV